MKIYPLILALFIAALTAQASHTNTCTSLITHVQPAPKGIALDLEFAWTGWDLCYGYYWMPVMPSGWRITHVTGDSRPETDGEGVLLLSFTIKNPTVLHVTIDTAGVPGYVSSAGNVWFSGFVNASNTASVFQMVVP